MPVAHVFEVDFNIGIEREPNALTTPISNTASNVLGWQVKGVVSGLWFKYHKLTLDNPDLVDFLE